MIAMSLEQQIKDKAVALGFDAVGITDASPIGAEHVEHLKAWLQSGCAGRMDYMHRNLEKRIHPAKLLDSAKSVIVVALVYKPPATATAVGWAMPTISPTCREPVGKVAQYAQYEDYHLFIKALLGELVDSIRAKTDRMQRFKICVDSSPLAEKALAVRAGLGFIGRNHLLIHPQLGPQVLLGEIVTTASLGPDQEHRGSCASCDRCLKACPTGALRPDGFLDASRCISYLTQYEPQVAPLNSFDGADSDESHDSNHTVKTSLTVPPRDDWLFGCDECLLACPYQQNAPACANQRFKWYGERAGLNLRDVLELTAEEFEARFHDSPVRRLGLEMLRHNARRCLKL
jgi:epoxyqueuosine reductase